MYRLDFLSRRRSFVSTMQEWDCNKPLRLSVARKEGWFYAYTLGNGEVVRNYLKLSISFVWYTKPMRNEELFLRERSQDTPKLFSSGEVERT
jgi:hypothetical protein